MIVQQYCTRYRFMWQGKKYIYKQTNRKQTPTIMCARFLDHLAYCSVALPAGRWTHCVHGYRRFTQASASGHGDIYIHMQAPSAFRPLTVGSLFVCSKTFFLSGITCMFLAQMSSFHWAGLCVGALPWISFSSTFFWWWTHKCWPKPRTKELKTPAFQTDSSSFFFFFFLMVYSWRDFGRALTSWKIQCCPRVLPHMRRMKLAGNKLIPGAFGMSREASSDRQASTISHRKSWGFAFESEIA